MSVIAWDGKTLAADRQATDGNNRRALRDKIFHVSAVDMGSIHIEPAYLAVAGDYETSLLLLQWYKQGRRACDWPKSQREESFSNLVIVQRGPLVLEYQATPTPQTVLEPFAAWGSGAPYALGAMAQGATAEQAVKIASQFNIHCGMGVVALAASAL